MEIEVSLGKSPAEIEKAVLKSHFDCIEIYEPAFNVRNEGTVYIISEEEPHYIVPATLARGKKELEDMVEEDQRLMKCVILVDEVKVNGKQVTQGDKLSGIKGTCIDDGGDNYFVYPVIPLDETLFKQLEVCQCDEIQDYLTGRE